MAERGCLETTEPLPCPAFTNRIPENTLEDEHWKHRPPYTMQTEAEFGPVKWRGKCLCEKVNHIMKQNKPLSSKYCHCRGCQITHGAPLQWSAIFHKDEMLFTSGASCLVFYPSTHQSQEYDLPNKVSCSNCRTPIMNEGQNVCLIFPQLIELEGSTKEQRERREILKPKCHIFYDSRIIEIHDGLPKWRGMENASGRIDAHGNQLGSDSE